MRSDRESIPSATKANIFHQWNYTTTRLGARKLR
jgi:hypothetical protein